MPSTLEKKKSKAKRKGEPIPDFISKAGRIKQKQQQTVIVNINKQKRGERGRSSIEKPKEKEQPKTTNMFSFSMPQTQNPIGEYIKMFNKDLYAKIEQAIKTKDPVINSLDEPVSISKQAVKELKRIPTPLETIPQPPTLDNFIKNQEELNKPLTIGEPTQLDDITTLEEPESISLDEEPEETKTEETVESLKKVEPTPDLFEILATPPPSAPQSPVQLGSPSPKRDASPIQLGVPVEPSPIIKKRGRPPLSDEQKVRRAIEIETLRRPVGRPGFSQIVNRPIIDEEKVRREIELEARKRPEKNELRARLDNRYIEEAPVKPAPQRRASLNLGRPIGTSM